MNFANFNPSMFNNIDHNQMKMASDMMSGMSDEQLRSYASMMGMPQMDPQMMRNQMNMMKGMDSSQFENMKNAAKNFAPPGGAGSYSGYSPSSQNEGLKRQHSTPVSDPKPVSKYTRIENLKIKGNDFFKKGQYDQAGSAYFEAIIEIEELRSQNKKLKDDDLDTLEISCRMNYANVKSKEEDYDTVLSQAKKVLAIKENGKAYFRLGQAQFHLKKYNEALQSLNKAIPLLPGDSTVSDLRDKVQNILSSSSQEEKEEPKKKKQEASEEPKVVEENREEPKEEHKPKLKKKNAPKVEDLPLPAHKPKEERYSAPPESIIREKPYEEEVKIEEEKAQPAPPRQESSTSSGFNYGNYGPNVSEEKFKQGQQHLSNMSPDQMKMMTDYFKGMDNATLKTMLKGQMGMDISDSQLESMKMMMTPEMLQNVSKMDMSQMPKGAFPSSAGTTSTSSSRPAQPAGTCTHDHDHSEHDHHHHHAQPQPQGMPGMPTMPPGMDFKLEQAQGMIDMMIQNPEMLKNMIGMIGEGNPIAKFVKNRSPQDLAKYLKVLRAGLKVYAKVSPLINFLKKYWQLIAGMMIAWAIIRIFNLA